MSGTQVLGGAKCVIGMQRFLLSGVGTEIPRNEDINSVVFKFSFIPAKDGGSFSTADQYSSDKIVVSR